MIVSAVCGCMAPDTSSVIYMNLKISNITLSKGTWILVPIALGKFAGAEKMQEVKEMTKVTLTKKNQHQYRNHKHNQILQMKRN